MNIEQDNPTKSDYRHVKTLALIAILASQIPILMSIHTPRGFTMTQRKTFPLFVGQKLYTVDGNPLDGMKTNYVEVLATSNGWTRLRYDAGYCITLTDDTVTTCYRPVPRHPGQ